MSNRESLRDASFEVLDFIMWHYDCVGQEEWFDFCELVSGLIAEVGNCHRFAGDLVARYPDFYYDAREGESLI